MSDSNNEIVLSGAALKAAVTAAENRLSGGLVKRNLATQLGLTELTKVDLRDDEVPPATLPIHPWGGGDDD